VRGGDHSGRVAVQCDTMTWMRFSCGVCGEHFMHACLGVFFRGLHGGSPLFLSLFGGRACRVYIRCAVANWESV
jgi:hypothetical protein